MLDLKIQIDSNLEEIDSQKDFCRDLLIKYEEIGCHKGEALIFYIHGILEKKEAYQLKNRDFNFEETISLLEKRLSRCIPETKDQCQEMII